MKLAPLVAFVSLVFFAQGVSAQEQGASPWTGPNPAARTYILGHAEENFSVAVTEVCFPFLFQNADARTWSRERRRGVAAFPAGGPVSGLSAYLVGGGAGAVIGVGERGAGRECTIEHHGADPEQALSTLRSLIARMPMVMTPSAQAFPPGLSGQRLVWCSPSEGAPVAVLASVAGTERPGNAAVMLVTFVQLAERDARCDTAPDY